MPVKTRINEPIEYKSLTMSVKDVDTKNGIITGYYGAFNNIDYGRDMMMPGAAAKTILERGPLGTKQIKHLRQHDRDFPFGFIQTLKEDNFGIYFETKATKGVQYCDDMVKFYADEVYNEHSIGYSVIRSTFIQNPPDESEFHWELNEIKLFEGSTVLWGMNEKTPFTGFKAGDRNGSLQVLNEQLLRIFKGLRIPGLSDESYIELEKQHALILSKISNIDSLILTAPSSAKDTHKKDTPEDEAKRLKEARDKDEFNQITKSLIKYF